MPFTLPDLPYAYDALEPTSTRDDGDPPRQAPSGLRRQRERALEGTEWAERRRRFRAREPHALPDESRPRSETTPAATRTTASSGRS